MGLFIIYLLGPAAVVLPRIIGGKVGPPGERPANLLFALQMEQSHIVIDTASKAHALYFQA